MVALFVVAEGFDFACKQSNRYKGLCRMKDEVEYLGTDWDVGHCSTVREGKIGAVRCYWYSA